MLKAIHAQESRDAADRKASAIVDDLRTARMNTAADLVERSVSETLTYYAFPDIHWQKIRTNNLLERIMREICRRTRVVGAFPDGQSCLNLAAARLRYIVGHRMVHQVLHEHAASLSAATHANRSRRLIKCAKDLHTTPAGTCQTGLVVPPNITISGAAAEMSRAQSGRKRSGTLRDNWPSNRVFKILRRLVHPTACGVGTNSVNQPWRIMSIGLRQSGAYRF